MVDTPFHGRGDGRRHRTVDYAATDYPGTMYWIPARNTRTPRQPRRIRFVVIHITGGPAMDESSAINQFRAGPSSAHYIVNRQGLVTQMVRDADLANHVDNIASPSNRDSIGIEHVNPWNRQTQLHPTEPQYDASARLVGWLCATYGIPAIHSTVRGAPGIRGHIEEQPRTTHLGCPNPAWAWGRYIAKVQGALAQGPTFADTIADLAR